MARGVDLPQLLDADRVGLGIGARAQPELGLELLRQRAAAAFREQRVSRVQLHAWLEVGLGLAFAIEPHRAGRDPLDPAILAVKDLGGGEPGIDLGAKRLRLLAEPFHHVPEAHDVVAGIVHLRRRRQGERTLRCQVDEPVPADRGVQGRSLRPPVRQQLVQCARLQHGAGQGMRAQLGCLVEHADAHLAIVLRGELAQSDGGGQPRRAGTDDDHVELHALPFHRSGSFRPIRGRAT